MRRQRRDFDEDEDEDGEIEDVETYRGEPEKKYSHELLVMEQLRRTLKAASQEMRRGWEERKINRSGQTASIKVHPDTRKEFASHVESLKNILQGYVLDDKETKKAIENLYQELKELEKNFKEQEDNAWNNIPIFMKRPTSGWIDRWEHIPNTLNYDHIYGEKYLQLSVDIYRRILEEIILLLHKMDYFKGVKIK